jgi:hypothetical protein
MIKSLPSGAIVIQLTGDDPVADAAAIADGLARCGADLYCVDQRAVRLLSGALISLNRDELPKLVSEYIFTKSLAITADGRYEAVFCPVSVDERLLRIILTGTDFHRRADTKLSGGDLAARLPRVASDSIGLAA